MKATILSRRFHVEHPEDEEGATLSPEVLWARDQATARLTCAVEGHVTDPKEADHYDQVPCLCCGQWLYVD